MGRGREERTIFQLQKHTALSVERGGFIEEQSFREISFVVRLEDIFA